jgi:beta-catenin-like protein 1
LKFVDILGLRTIFPLFMKTPKKNKQRSISAEEFEEHVCSIIASMLRNSKGSQKTRLHSKFVENDFEKVDRLMELHLKYLEKVEIIDKEIEHAKKFRQPDEEDDAEEEEANYVKRLSGGLFTLQLIDYIILEISISADGTKVKQRIQQILNLRKSSMKIIKDVMREYAGNLGDAQTAEWRENEKQHILGLINRF